MGRRVTVQTELTTGELHDRYPSATNSVVANFIDISSEVEVSPDGSTFRMKSRPRSFFNIIDFLEMFAQFADIQSEDILADKRPRREDITVAVDATTEMLDAVASLVKRADDLRAGKHTYHGNKEDNMLRIVHEGRELAASPRQVGILTGPSPKVEAVADKMAEVFQRYGDILAVEVAVGNYYDEQLRVPINPIWTGDGQQWRITKAIDEFCSKASARYERLLNDAAAKEREAIQFEEQAQKAFSQAEALKKLMGRKVALDRYTAAVAANKPEEEITSLRAELLAGAEKAYVLELEKSIAPTQPMEIMLVPEVEEPVQEEEAQQEKAVAEQVAQVQDVWKVVIDPRCFAAPEEAATIAPVQAVPAPTTRHLQLVPATEEPRQPSRLRQKSQRSSSRGSAPRSSNNCNWCQPQRRPYQPSRRPRRRRSARQLGQLRRRS